MKFGKDNCSSIEVDPFEPICSFPTVGGTTPLELDVPFPSFVTPLPPNECACFDFVSTTTDTVIVDDCETSKSPKCVVEIKQADPEDCCSGRYIITPTMEIPCMPFAVGEPQVSLGNTSGDKSRGIDGALSLSVEKNCCSLDTTVDVKLPDCIKGFDPSAAPATQISYCKREDDGHVSYNNHKLIEIVADEENCSLYPKVNPIDLPCCTLPDGVLSSGVFDLDKRGSNVSWKLTRTDCDLDLEVTPHIVDCACFSFTRGESEVEVTDCNTPGRVSVDIKKVEGTDCCDGQFEVNASASIPCIPFDIEQAKVEVRNKHGSRSNVDGNVEVEIDQECCTLTPRIKFTAPSCIKRYTVPPETQFEYLDHGVKKSHTFVTYEENEDECLIDHIYHPLDLPCPLSDYSTSGSASLSNVGGTIEWGLTFKDCALDSFKIVTTPIPMPVIPPGPCLDPTSMRVQFEYTDKKGGKHQSPQKTVNFKVQPGNPCPKYVTEEDCVMFDLGTISGGGSGGVGFVNGGDVNLSSDGTLRIDGSASEAAETWYGGGYGDRDDNKHYDFTWCRGPDMRNTDEVPPGVVVDPDTSTAHYDAIPWAEVGSAYVRPVGDDHDSEYADIYWESGRSEPTEDPEEDDEENPETLALSETPGQTPAAGDDGSGEGIGSDEEGEEEEEQDPWEWSSTANLNLVWATGQQWHKRGVAMSLTEFQFNDSGILSYATEKQEATLLAPGLAVMKSDNEKNASGLRVLSDMRRDNINVDKEYYRIEHGLRVDAGYGLRIYGSGDGRTDSDDKLRETARQGSLEIMYGIGLRVRGEDDAEGKPTYIEKSVDAPGALTFNEGKGLRLHGATKKFKQYPQTLVPETYPEPDDDKNKLELHCFDKDLRFHKDGRLVLNDKMVDGWYINIGEEGLAQWYRDSGIELTETIMAPYVSTNYGWTKLGGVNYPGAEVEDLIDKFRKAPWPYQSSCGKTGAALCAIVDEGIRSLEGRIVNILDIVAVINNFMKSWTSSLFGHNNHYSDTGLLFSANSSFEHEDIKRIADEPESPNEPSPGEWLEWVENY